MSISADNIEIAPKRRGGTVRQSAEQRELLTHLALELSAVQDLEALGRVLRSSCEHLCNWDAFMLSVRRSGVHAQFRGIVLVDTVDGVKQEFAPFNYSARIYKRLAPLLEGCSVLLNRTPPVESSSTEGIFGDEGRRSMSIIYAPVSAGDAVVGILSVQSYTPNAFTPEDRDRLAHIADLIGPAVQRCRAEERGRAFSSLGHRLSSSNTPTSVAEIIVGMADVLLGWDACTVDFYHADEDILTSVLAKDEVDGRRGVDVESPGSGTRPGPIARAALNSNARLILRNPGNEPDTKGFEAFGDKQRSSASLMFAPIRASGRIVGIISIQSYTYDAYSTEDLEILQALADHCGGALERTFTRQKLAESEERHRLLVENVNDGIVISQKDRFIHFNMRFAQMLG